MREAVGGSLLFYIMIGFIFIFIVFIAVIMNYAAAYRASNYAITMIERTEGAVKVGSGSDEAGSNTIVGQLKKRKYYNTLKITCSSNTNGAVYQVTTSVPFEVPLIGVKMNLKIKNETKTIYGKECNNNSIANKTINIAG